MRTGEEDHFRVNGFACCLVIFLFLDLGMDDEGDDDPVPLPNVNAAILKKVRCWKWSCGMAVMKCEIEVGVGHE